MTGAFGRRQRFVENGEGAIGSARPRLGLGQGDLQEPVEHRNVLIAQELGAAAHLLESAARRAALSPRQALEKDPVHPPEGQIMLTREPGEFDSVRRGPREVAAQEFEHGRVRLRVCVRADVRNACDPRLGVANDGGRTSDLAQRPQDNREVRHRPDGGVVSEAERQIVVAPGSKQGQRLFEMFSRFVVLSGEPMRESGCAVSDAGLGRIGLRFNVA